MKYFLLILILLIPLNLFAITGEDVRTDWTLGESQVVIDATSPCTDTAVARADWSLGEVTTVIDATANCTAAVAAAAAGVDSIIWFK